ncbi:MAG: hypothetical protein GY768_05475 [Planctomycetaceae bacterium]|nr:hypothetical protein [Planctomycetaceae bacterium]
MSTQFFDDSEQEQLMADDSEAWRAVCGILMTIVGLGVCIAFLALFLIFLFE